MITNLLTEMAEANKKSKAASKQKPSQALKPTAKLLNVSERVCLCQMPFILNNKTIPWQKYLLTVRPCQE
jgi:hypothetical protein